MNHQVSNYNQTIVNNAELIDNSTKLPEELLLKTFSYLFNGDLLACSLVDKRWRAISRDNSIKANLKMGQIVFKKLIVTPEKLSLREKEILESTVRLSLGGGLDFSACNPKTYDELFKVNEIYICEFRKSKDIDLYDIRSDLITADALKQLPKRLKSLTLRDCSFSDVDVFKLLPEGLESLVLNNCTNISDERFKHLSRSLKKLSIYTDQEITDEALKHFPPDLEHLTISSCKNLTKQGIDQLPKSIKFVYIKCPKVVYSKVDSTKLDGRA